MSSNSSSGMHQLKSFGLLFLNVIYCTKIQWQNHFLPFVRASYNFVTCIGAMRINCSISKLWIKLNTHTQKYKQFQAKDKLNEDHTRQNSVLDVNKHTFDCTSSKLERQYLRITLFFVSKENDTALRKTFKNYFIGKLKFDLCFVA